MTRECPAGLPLRQSLRYKAQALPSKASRKTSTPQAPPASWCFIFSLPLLNLSEASSASARLPAPACRLPEPGAEKADAQNSTPRYQRSLWPKGSMLTKQIPLTISAKPCIFHGQRCTGISTLAGGMWRNRNALLRVNFCSIAPHRRRPRVYQ
jgi:hypothetical protein